MTSNAQNIIWFEVKRGDDQGLRVRVVNDDTSIPMDISGWSIKFTMKRSISHTDENAAVAIDIPKLVGEQARIGIVTIELLRAHTESLRPGPYFFDIQREMNSKVTTMMSGRINLVADVTQRTGIQ